MMFLYNIGIALMSATFWLASAFNKKAKLLVEGRSQTFDYLKKNIDPTKPLLWFHAASLGEFEQGRPVIEKLRNKYPDHKILLTFFSPSGYMIRKDYKGADYICYLPADSLWKVKRFLNITNPQIAVFIKYEFWLNFINACRARGIKLYSISAIFRKEKVFFKPWGGIFRNALKKFDHIFVQDQYSADLLKGINVENVTVAGDTRFDRVSKIASESKNINVLDIFSENAQVVVAGSTWSEDEDILLPFINRHKELKFIIAPHEIDRQRINKFVGSVEHGNILYTTVSEYDRDKIKEAQVLIIDTIGILSSAYRYGKYAYIGGGFGVGIHNTLEAAAYSIPVSFGPNYHKFNEAVQLIENGGGLSVSSYEELQGYIMKLQVDANAYNEAAQAAGNYVKNNVGATGKIIRLLVEEIA